MRWWWVSAAGLSACGSLVDEDVFLEDYPQDMCQHAITCLWPDTPQDVETCAEERRAWFDQYQDCEFDAKSAGDCLTEIRSLSCDSIEYRFPETNPGSCAYVYVCPYTTSE